MPLFGKCGEINGDTRSEVTLYRCVELEKKPTKLKTQRRNYVGFVKNRFYQLVTHVTDGPGDPEITPGIQTKAPIEYTLFDRF